MTGRDIERREPLNGDGAGGAEAVCQGAVEGGDEDALPCEPAVSLDHVFRRFTDAAARGTWNGLTRTAASVDLANDDSWWPCSTIDGITVPIGRNPAGGVSTLSLDSGGHTGALLIGPPGSGKSTLLHNFIAGATALYGPDEMELYLVDFAEGFGVYATESLPHARLVIARSDRESGLGVLRSLMAELSRREALLRTTSGRGRGLAELRRSTSEVVPRVVLLVDGSQELLCLDDEVGCAAADLLEQLIRKGGSLGIHVVLSSQSFECARALRPQVLDCLPVRIVLLAGQVDARRTGRSATDVGQQLKARRDGILNSAGGAIEHDEPFQLAEGDGSAREQRVIAQRRLAEVRSSRGRQ